MGSYYGGRVILFTTVRFEPKNGAWSRMDEALERLVDEQAKEAQARGPGEEDEEDDADETDEEDDSEEDDEDEGDDEEDDPHSGESDEEDEDY